MGKIHYIKCPRCELNYIDARQDMCDVCKEELGKPINEPYEEEERELCPLCKQNYLNYGEEICEQCASEKAENPEEDEGWRNYLDEEDVVDEEEDEMLPLEGLQDEELNEVYDEEEKDSYTGENTSAQEKYQDDFEDVFVDDYDEDEEDENEDDEEDEDDE